MKWFGTSWRAPVCEPVSMRTENLICGGPHPAAKGSQARRCARCPNTAYFSPATFKRIKDEKIANPEFICMDCIPGHAEIKPITAAQLSELHAEGCDMTGAQINDLAQKLRRK